MRPAMTEVKLHQRSQPFEYETSVLVSEISKNCKHNEELIE